MAVSGQPVRLQEVPAQGPGPRRRRWRRLAARLGWVFGCTVLGTALMVLPWVWVWERNYFATYVGDWSALWLSPYLRGAVTGLGVVNVGISFRELLRLWK